MFRESSVWVEWAACRCSTSSVREEKFDKNALLPTVQAILFS